MVRALVVLFLATVGAWGQIDIEKQTKGTIPVDRLPATVVLTTGSYSDPAWLTALSKSKVGLGNVENTALSTWTGSTNITTIGTLSAGTVPWARLSNVPSSFTPSAHTHSGEDITSAVANAINATNATNAINAINATTAVSATALSANGTNCPAGYAAAGVDASGNAEDCIQVVGGAVEKQLNFLLWDPTTSLPATTIDAIWRPEYATATFTQVACNANTANAVIQFTGIVLTSNLTCGNGTWATTTSFSNAVIPVGSSLGFRIVSGTATRISVSLRYMGN